MTDTETDWRTHMRWFPERVEVAERGLRLDLDNTFEDFEIGHGDRIPKEAIREIADALRGYANACAWDTSEDMWPVVITTECRYVSWAPGSSADDAVRYAAGSDSPQWLIDNGAQISGGWDTEPADPADLSYLGHDLHGPSPMCPKCRRTPSWGGWPGMIHERDCEDRP